MRSIYRLSLLLTMALSGCVTTGNYARFEPQLDQWLQQKEYGRALNALSRVDPTDPDYSKAAEQRKKVEALAANYEQQVRKETREQQGRGDWAAALDLYDIALDRLPTSAILKDGLAKLTMQQREALNELELKRLLQHGQWLRQTLPITADMARIDPRNTDARRQHEKTQQEAELIANELAQYGNRALADNDLKSANLTLSLAAELSNSPVIEESRKKLRKQQDSVEAQERREREQRREQNQRASVERERREAEIEERYRSAFTKRNYAEARRQLQRLHSYSPNHPRVDAMEQQLEKAIQAESDRLYDIGISAYSRGQFESAAKAWREALSINPNHQAARDSLERAEKVLEKIEALKQKQAQ